jgi:hypothetical protein
MTRLAALLSGLVFGLGLVVSGMTDPAKVHAFLDLFGKWDPSLAFVMAGAIGVHAALRPFVLRRASPMFATRFDVPLLRAIDGRLVAGAAIFGIGWGLGGVCPGPAIVCVGNFGIGPLAFVGAMALGVVLERVSLGRRAVAS